MKGPIPKYQVRNIIGPSWIPPKEHSHKFDPNLRAQRTLPGGLGHQPSVGYRGRPFRASL